MRRKGAKGGGREEEERQGWRECEREEGKSDEQLHCK